MAKSAAIRRAASRNGQNGPALGENLRQRRKALGLTLQQVASRAGLTAGFISQIERDLAVPSLSSLASVARVLGAEIGEFLHQPQAPGAATRSAERAPFRIGKGAASYERLSAGFAGNRLHTVLIHAPPGYRGEPISHEGEELFFVVTGAMTVEIEGTRTVLKAGDSLHFQSTRRHSNWNHTTRPVTVLITCTMDIFGDGPAPVQGAGPGHVVRRNSALRPRKSTPPSPGGLK